MLIIDVGVPRDVEPAVADLPGVTLRNLDDLQDVVRRTVRLRTAEMDQARERVCEHVAELTRTLTMREVTPTLEAFQKLLEDVAAEELAAAKNKLSTHEDADEDEAVLRRALHRTVRRILHPAARNLRNQAGTSAAGAHAATLRKLFGLEQPEE
jgi:glutamyl-tRNA reductase